MEDTSEVVEMKEIDGSTLRQLVSFLYGRDPDLRHDPMSLFVAADAHQVATIVACLNVQVHAQPCEPVRRWKRSGGLVYNA